jgi:FlaG/FlaF family flagellin (archaellin)
LTDGAATGRMAARAASSVVGVVLLTAVTVLAASAVGAAVVVEPPERPPLAAFDLAADPSGEVRLTHAGGDPVDPERLDLHVRVDGEPLAEQPPIPFFAASGFESGPTGAFNSATDSEWRAGEVATFRLAETNEPGVEPGATVEVRLSVDGQRIATLGTTV